MFNWLCFHSAICGAQPKETFFFMDPEHPLAGRHGFDCTRDGPGAWYKFFRTAADASIFMEATTHYFYQRVAMDHVSSYFPQSRVLLIVREPASRILSSFLFTRNVLGNCDRGLRFSEYAHCLIENKMEAIKNRFTNPASYWALAREIGFSRYVDWVTWWLEGVARERFKIVVFERIQEAPEVVVTDICNWLGINPDSYRGFTFTKENQGYSVMHGRIHRWARAFAPHVPAGVLRETLKERYMSWRDAGRAADDEDVSEALYALRQNLGPYNRLLEETVRLGTDRYWAQPGGSSG